MSAEKAPSQNEQRDVADEDHQADLPAREVIDQLRDAAHATRGEVGGDEECAKRERLNECGEDDEEIIAEGGKVFFHFVFW